MGWLKQLFRRNKFYYSDGTTSDTYSVMKILYRLDSPAVEYGNGDRLWYQNNLLHRTDGPAVELANGTKAWYQNGLRHRTDGPAAEYPSGNKQYWINGVHLEQLDNMDIPAERLEKILVLL